MAEPTTTPAGYPRIPLMERVRWAVDIERQCERGTVAHGYAAGHVAGVAEIAGLLLDEEPVDLIREARGE